MKPALPILLVLLLGFSSAVAHARDDSPPGRTRRDLRELAAKISGGALLVDVASSRPTQAFHDRARRFENAVERRDQVGDDWREICSSLRSGSSKRLVRMVNPRFCTTASSS